MKTGSSSKGSSFVQAKVDQGPKWDNDLVISRKHRIIRANKRKQKRRFL